MEIQALSRETTNLLDVDRAFGRWLKLAFKNTVVSDVNRTENKAAIKFFASPPAEQVFQFDDHGEVLKFKQRLARVAKAKNIKAQALPAVYYSAGSVVDSAALGDYVPEFAGAFESADPDSNQTIETFKDKVNLSYRVVLCAWDTPTLNALTMALRAYLRQVLMFKGASEHFKRSAAYIEYGKVTKFEAKTMILGLSVTLDVEIESIGSEMMSKASLPLDGERLLANEIEIRVTSDVVTGFSYDHTEMDYEDEPCEFIT